jgi:type I restriction enzyme S subunit
MSEWREVRLGDVADVIGGGTPKTSVEEYWNGSIPWLAPRDLTGYSKVYISHGDRFITEKGLKKAALTPQTPHHHRPPHQRKRANKSLLPDAL